MPTIGRPSQPLPRSWGTDRRASRMPPSRPIDEVMLDASPETQAWAARMNAKAAARAKSKGRS